MAGRIAPAGIERRLSAIAAVVGLGLAGCYVGGLQQVGEGDEIGSSQGGGSESGGEESGDGPVGEPGVAGPAVLRRLTVAQYQSSVRDLLGDDVTFSSELGDVEPVLDDGEYASMAAARDGFSEADVSAWHTGSITTVEPVFADPERRVMLVGCTPATSDDACAREYIARFGRRAFRRPLADDEIDRFVVVATTTDAELGGAPWHGLQYATAAILQSPSMLYVPELGEPDTAHDRMRYTSLEMASRIAFAITNRGPDDALLDAGEAGELVELANVLAHAERLLDAPNGRRSITEDLFGEYFQLAALDGLGKDPDEYPKWNASVAAAMREETHRVLDWAIFDADLTLAQMLENRTTFVDAQLADIYGMPAPLVVGFSRFDIPDDWVRVGLLGLGSFLAINAKTHRTAPTIRGHFILSRLLCSPISAPVTGVPPLPEIPEGDGYQTMRERLEQHATDPSCSGCHAQMDPLGLALEHFDGIGAHRENDHGEVLDVSGELDGVQFDGSVELARVLADHASLRPCLARQLFRYASGATEQDPDLVDAISALGEETDGNVRELLLAIVTSDAFRYFRAEG
jgi:uncharacterized protein DUF1592/uncharacterized protein DUF1588/uncharacterized protein DUF1595/uncharacterized protein DUF1585/uncharacterized protein DUF1587